MGSVLTLHFLSNRMQHSQVMIGVNIVTTTTAMLETIDHPFVIGNPKPTTRANTNTSIG